MLHVHQCNAAHRLTRHSPSAVSFSGSVTQKDLSSCPGIIAEAGAIESCLDSTLMRSFALDGLIIALNDRIADLQLICRVSNVIFLRGRTNSGTITDLHAGCTSHNIR